MDFLNFFGLKEDPFKLTPDPAYFYPSASHNEGLLLMDYAIDQKEGFLLIIGDPGTGKTTLLKVFLTKWNDMAEIAIVLTPRLSPEEFLVSVAEDLNIRVENKNKNEIIRALRDFMTDQSSQGKRVIIIVDEAQNLPDETLEELRLLSNLETDKDKLIQIILLGQPELESKLSSTGLRQLNQRISTRVHLKHFSPDETLEYINYRVIKAGKKNLQIHKKVSRRIFKLSQGTPRLINMLISRALMAAFLEESNIILTRHINHAVSSLKHSEMKVEKSKVLPIAAALASAVLLGSAVYVYMSFHKKAAPLIASGIQEVNVSEQDVPSFTRTEAAAVPVPNLKVLHVDVDVAIVRYKPSTVSRKAGWILKGNQLVVLNEVADENHERWYQILYQGEKRWISDAVVTLAGVEEAVVPLIETPELKLPAQEGPGSVTGPGTEPEESLLPNDSTGEAEYTSRRVSSIE